LVQQQKCNLFMMGQSFAFFDSLLLKYIWLYAQNFGWILAGPDKSIYNAVACQNFNSQPQCLCSSYLPHKMLNSQTPVPCTDVIAHKILLWSP
jgi:hypothetical protein